MQDNILFNKAETEYIEATNRKKNDLLNIYNHALSQYYSNLQRQRNDLTIINYNLSNKKMLLNHDILSLKAKTSKLLTKFEKFIDLKTNDEIEIKGEVFSDALGDAWVEVKSLTITKKAPEEKKDKS